jgi:hypothetical protein
LKNGMSPGERGGHCLPWYKVGKERASGDVCVNDLGTTCEDGFGTGADGPRLTLHKRKRPMNAILATHSAINFFLLHI